MIGSHSHARTALGMVVSNAISVVARANSIVGPAKTGEDFLATPAINAKAVADMWTMDVTIVNFATQEGIAAPSAVVWANWDNSSLQSVRAGAYRFFLWTLK